MNRRQYEAHISAEEYGKEVRQREANKAEAIKDFDSKRGRLPIDYTYYNTSDEESLSDYDVTERELYPRQRNKVTEKRAPGSTTWKR